jgi:hypothetical protein
MKRLLVLAAAAAAGAFAQDVHVDYDHQANFAQYHTFAWRAPHSAAKANSIVDNTLVRERLEHAVDAQLVKKGLSEATVNPDVYLEYHIAAQNERLVNHYPGYWGGWRWGGYWGPSTTVTRLTRGTVVLDMIDAHTNQLVWRSYATDTGRDPLDANSEKHVNKIAAKTFEKFPPAPDSHHS